jgi:hypothetical protein
MNRNSYESAFVSLVYCDIDSEWRHMKKEKQKLLLLPFHANALPSVLLVLIPFNKWYGNAHNIYVNDIQKHLIDYGF